MYALLLLVLLLLLRLLWKAKNETTNTTGFGRGAFMSLLALVTIASGIGAYIFSSSIPNPSNTSDFVQDNQALSIMSGISSLETETLLISVALLLVTLVVAYIVFFRKQKKK